MQQLPWALITAVEIVALVSLASCGAPPDARHDGGALDAEAPPVDAGLPSDAGLDGAMTSSDAAAGLDAGSLDSGAPDEGFDSGRDAGIDAAVDAGRDAGVDGGIVGPSDAGPPPRPVGAAQEITGLRCALDTPSPGTGEGNFWCWGRWTPVEAVRLLGSGFSSPAGSCALRGREVWCADFSSETMIPVIEGSATAELDRIAEYSRLEYGCGLRATGAGDAVVCWADGEINLVDGGGAEIVAVSATEPRHELRGSGLEALDLNMRRCWSLGHRVECDTAGLRRPAGDWYVLGFHMSCAHSLGVTQCDGGGGLFPITVEGPMHDQAVAWPVGVDDLRRGLGMGICISSGLSIRCWVRGWDAATSTVIAAWEYDVAWSP